MKKNKIFILILAGVICLSLTSVALTKDTSFLYAERVMQGLANMFNAEGEVSQIIWADGTGPTTTHPTGGGGGLTWVNKTGAYTATAGEGILVDTDTGAITITLPASPTISDRVGIIDEDSNSSVNTITIGRNGSPIMSETEDMTIDNDGAALILVYADATRGWVIESATVQGATYTTGIIIGSGTRHDGYVVSDADELATSDATQSTLGTITLLDSNVYFIEAHVSGVQSDDTDHGGYHISCLAYRAGGGAVIEGSVGNVAPAVESNAALDCTFTVSGNNVLLSVTGIAAETWRWTATKISINGSSS